MNRSLPVLLLALLPALAQASLGGAADSVASDRTQLRSTAARAEPALGFTVQTLQLPIGTTVREYLNSAGTVFAVSWKGRLRPDLHQLLGVYYPQYHSATLAIGGRHPVGISSTGLVLVAEGHGRRFQGRAWIPDLLPAGVSGADIQ